jgi:hypothetical protein
LMIFQILLKKETFFSIIWYYKYRW